MSKPTQIDQWLEQLGNPAADRDYKPGHERLLKLLSHVELHRPKLRIRIAGTNGKGSTAFMLASALRANGYRVGLYTSPHILSFNERMRIDLVPVTLDEVAESLERLMPHALDCGTSYFETATAVALDLFSRHKVDIEILEAGVGARLDATTAIEADMALITPIGLDHQAWLGDSLTEIASEKAYITQGCRYALSAPQDAIVSALLRNFCPQLKIVEAEIWDHLTTAGVHQQLNASLAQAAVQALQNDFNLDIDRAGSAIADCRVPGRLQQLQIGDATVWVDAAHNRHAIEALLPTLPTLADPFDSIIVFTREDRSLDDCRPLLQPHCRKLITRSERTSATEALNTALSDKPAGKHLVLGSFLTVAEILQQFNKQNEG